MPVAVEIVGPFVREVFLTFLCSLPKSIVSVSGVFASVCYSILFHVSLRIYFCIWNHEFTFIKIEKPLCSFAAVCFNCNNHLILIFAVITARQEDGSVV